ncbi:hypothetical protein OUZ56_019223 [Daphnia magna]|uniref:Uncharacterized protein n=1 Tax=Daphnia magna TaxID=35525 RepID=A0ABQ9ZB12_9CRUS|nr:hypothetical protein OUZ56_019223 [Daphnia magna]
MAVDCEDFSRTGMCQARAFKSPALARRALHISSLDLLDSSIKRRMEVCLEEEEEKKHTDRKREREKKRKSIGSLVGLDNYCALFG